MPALTLKEIPEELLVRLRAVAKRERRSVMQEAIFLLEGGVTAREHALESPISPADLQVAQWRALAGSWQSVQSFDAEIADILAARTAGRAIEL